MYFLILTVDPVTSSWNIENPPLSFPANHVSWEISSNGTFFFSLPPPVSYSVNEQMCSLNTWYDALYNRMVVVDINFAL